MVQYVDPIPPIISLLKVRFGSRVNIYGNTFPSMLRLPALLVKTAGGNGAYRIQLLCRANDDITAMSTLVDVMNYFEAYGQYMPGIRVQWVERESNPIPSTDTDSGKPEAWCYMNLEALEA
ncbi:hypothetical protein V7124_19400 [Neobacillus niacini]|uniref:hypothetical protein n=1 Tax=Neobacillus niacini TaxID=86668 RepID=UPI002FFDE6E5